MSHPDFASRAFLTGQIRDAIGFYLPAARDPQGGFVNEMMNDGRVADPLPRGLVHACRAVFTHARGYMVLGDPALREAARHALDFLTGQFYDPRTGGYVWQLDFADGTATVRDDSHVMYGYAFVLLAHATALKAGIAEARPFFEDVLRTLDRRFLEPAHDLYVDQIASDWGEVRSYRGQNANMHACEAFIAAFEATGEARHLDRARTIAEQIAFVKPKLNPRDEVWEHYGPDWQVDMDYNRHDSSDGYRPWGFLAGHQTEWAKLLMMIDRHQPSDRLVDRAQSLFDRAMDIAWDDDHGGLMFSYAPSGSIHDDTKQQWVQAESLAAAWWLYARTGETRYGDWYDRIWAYAQEHLVDHDRGGWFRILGADNSLLSKGRGTPEPDYHNIGACADVLLRLEDPGE